MKKFTFLAAILFSHFLFADGSTTAHNISDTWFKPYLTVNKSPVCGATLKDLSQYFASSATGGFLDQPSFSKTLPLVEWGSATFAETAEVTLHGKKFIFGRKTDYFGGAAIQYQQLVIVPTDIKPTEEEYWKLYRETSFFLKDINSYHSLDLAEKDGVIYLIAQEKALEDKYQIFEFDRNLEPNLICEAQLGSPQALTENKSVENVLGILNVVTEIIGPEGDCGSMHAQSGHVQFMNKAFADALARPWAIISGPANGTLNENLQLWSIGGLWEHKLYQRFKKLYPLAQSELERFYIEKVGLEKNAAKKLAVDNLSSALESGFAFSRSQSPNYSRVRAAILDGEAIEKITLALDSSENDPKNSSDFLFIAVERPEVVALLLAKGWDPNVTNAFGKTPLMEAAQYDAVDAAKLLLKSGAITEATTHYPADHCAYQLSTTGMTALHYAVRYSSKQFIDLLIDNGAPIYFKDSRNYRAGFTPFDYLTRFGGEVSYDGKTNGLSWGQKNINLNPAEIIQLRQRMLIDTGELVGIAQKENLRGEADYATGKLVPAYGAFKRAEAANPESIRVQTNLSLAAMKLGKAGEAAKYASAVMSAKNASVHEQAAAYFNMGLICKNNSSVNYDEYYCREIAGDYFLTAYEIEPSASREKVIYDFFEKSQKDFSVCRTEKIMGKNLSWIYRGGEHSYLLVRSMQDPDLTQIYFRNQGKIFPIKIRESKTVNLTNGARILRIKTDGSLRNERVEFGQFACLYGQEEAVQSRSQ